MTHMDRCTGFVILMYGADGSMYAIAGSMYVQSGPLYASIKDLT